MGVLNQKTGNVKFLAFYPDRGTSVINSNMTLERLKDHASLTIQTTPETAQKVIDYIQSLGPAPQYHFLNNNCTTLCQNALNIAEIGTPESAFADDPDALWNTLYASHSNAAISARERPGNPFFAPPTWAIQYAPGVEFGRPRFSGPGFDYTGFLFQLYINQAEQQRSGKRKACVTVQGANGPDTSCEEY
jgi:hypothetical protein